MANEGETPNVELEIESFLDKAKDAGFDIPALVAEIAQTSEEDRQFRQGVMDRLDVLVGNQQAIVEWLKKVVESAGAVEVAAE